MKSLSIKLGVIVLGFSFFVFGCQIPIKKDEYSKEADWKLYAKSLDGKKIYYYGSKGITHPSENNVRVWTKGVLTNDLSYSKYILVELNCVDKKYKGLRTTDYSKNGEGKGSYDISFMNWSPILPGEMIEFLFKELCK